MPPSHPDQTLTTANVSTGINVDALNQLKCFVWDNPLGSITAELGNGLSQVQITISTTNSCFAPDVVVANDVTNPNNAIIGIVYTENTGINGYSIWFDTYIVQGINSSGMSYSLYKHVLMSNSAGRPDPHIDLFTNLPIGGAAPTRNDFVLTWDEYNSITALHSLYTAYGDISNPLGYTQTIITQSSNQIWADVAASHNLNNNHLSAYFGVHEDNKLYIGQYDFTTGTLINYSMLINIPLANAFPPRIEAMGLYNPTFSSNPWAIVDPIWNGSLHDLYIFDNSYPTGFVCSSPIFLGKDNTRATIAAGVGSGFNPSSPCNQNYYVGWGVVNSSGNIETYVTRSIDYASGLVLNPDFYQINTNPITGATKYPLAMASNNTGNLLLTSWYSNSKILYKTGHSIQDYKPTGIQKTNPVVNYSAYPNPAKEKLNIKGLKDGVAYSLNSISGKEVATGRINIANPVVDIHTLTPGIYTLNIYAGQQREHLQFVKQ